MLRARVRRLSAALGNLRSRDDEAEPIAEVLPDPGTVAIGSNVSNEHCISAVETDVSGVGAAITTVEPDAAAIESLPAWFAGLPDAPYVFGSDACRSDHFHLPLYHYWVRRFGEAPVYHRKQWEFVYVVHSLFERGMLQPGRKSLGFAVGAEPLPALFGSMGINVLATDLATEEAAEAGWVNTNQHADSFESLNKRGLCEAAQFRERVRFQFLDMRDIPRDLTDFDFCWSACALEHLGSIAEGERFIRSSVETLKPNGIAVHTTELNLSDDENTIDNGPTVLFRRSDISGIAERLRADGHHVEPVNFYTGEGVLAEHIDLPPYRSAPHLKLQIAQYAVTSVGLVIRRCASGP